MTNRFVSLLTLLVVLLCVVPSPTASASTEPAAVLKQVLGLTDAQINELQQLIRSRQAAIAPLINEMQPLEAALGVALDSGTTDPATIGALVLSIRARQRQIWEHDHNFRAAFQSLLTPEQYAQLNAIRGVEAAFRAAEALRLLGL